MRYLLILAAMAWGLSGGAALAQEPHGHDGMPHDHGFHEDHEFHGEHHGFRRDEHGGWEHEHWGHGPRGHEHHHVWHDGAWFECVWPFTWADWCE